MSVGVVLSDVPPLPNWPKIPLPSTTQHRCQGWRRCGNSRRERYCCATRTEATGERGCGFVRRSTITQSAVRSLSPARHRTVVKDGAGVFGSGRERLPYDPKPRLLVKRGRGFEQMFLHYPIGTDPSFDARHIPLSRMAQHADQSQQHLH